jgi:ATP-dependent DNA helicase HFM1/MER3
MTEMQCSPHGHEKYGKIRFVGLSATVPNIEDVARWLREPDGQLAIFYVFGEEFRPVRLDAFVLGCSRSDNGKNVFMFDHSLNYKYGQVMTPCCYHSLREMP